MLGLTMAYNEVDSVGNTVRCLLDAGHDRVYLFDHGSTDGTADAAIAVAGGDSRFVTQRVQRAGCDLGRLFRRMSTFVREHAGEYAWVTWLAADELLRPPEGVDLRREHIERAWKKGVRVISPTLREFWLSDADPSEESEPDYMKRVRYYKPRPAPNCPRGWATKFTGTMPYGLHRRNQDWPGRPRISYNRWLLDHYPIRSRAQAERKIMRERPWTPEHYRRYRRQKCENIVRPAAGLERAE